MESKPIWSSKTFYVNLFAGVAMIAQAIAGKEVLPLELQGTLLAVVNVVLRFVTKSAVTW